jgi:putative N6-adenine-specific DNA methylase
MDGFILTSNSFQDVASIDVKELLDKDLLFRDEKSSIGLIKDLTIGDLALLAFRAQSAKKVGVLLGSFDLSNDFSEDWLKDSFKKSFSEKDVSEWSSMIAGVKTFGVSVINETGDDNYSSVEVARLIGGVLFDDFKASNIDISVKLKQPQLDFFVYLSPTTFYYGLDLTGVQMERRPYKLLTKSSSINGVFAYAIARIAGLKKDSLMVDPFCGSGTIPIESALYQQGKSPFVFNNDFSAFRLPFSKDSFKSVSDDLKSKPLVSSKKTINGFDYILKIVMSAKKNAKLAGVFDACNFSKVDVEWLDSKFEENEVDIIITNPPKESAKKNNKQDIKKVYDELFYQSRYVLSKDGVLAILTNKTDLLEDLAKKHGFVFKEKRKLFSGEQPYILIQFNPPRPLGDDEI